MSSEQYAFYFEREGRAASHGAIAPAEEYFEGSRAEVSVVRETVQNSLDARAGDGPVRMVFELAEMLVDDVPDIVGLRSHLGWVVDATRGAQGHARMRTAFEMASGPTIQVLRISDYGTVGLRGSESVAEGRSPLSALTRGSGISANDGTRGGSFGIGSAVGPMASQMSTVLYTSMTPEKPGQVVFAGHSRLASHVDGEGDRRGGDGFYTEIGREDDFHYQRDGPPLGPFERRTESGTDVYVLAYRKAEDDPLLEHIRAALVDNFMMAVHRGRLEVVGQTKRASWVLDAETLADHVRDRPEAAPFYDAIRDPNPFVRHSRRLGELRLYVHVDDTLRKSLHTITMRKPLMKIGTFRHTSIPAKYAAVLVCESDAGNTALRELEPPQHDKWDPGRSPEGPKILRELKDAVRDGLRERVSETLGEVVDIKGLSRYLPSQVVTHERRGDAASSGEGAHEEESPRVHGGGETRTIEPAVRKRVSVPVSTSGAAGPGQEDVEKGRERGGEGERSSTGGKLPGSGTEGAGSSRIAASDVRFRSWIAPSHTTGRSVLTVALTADRALTGELELIALGPGGAPEPDFVLPVSAARLVSATSRWDISWTGNTFRGIQLEEGATTRLEIELPAGHRYRLGVR